MFKVSVFQPSPRSMHSHHKSKKTRNSHLCNTFIRTTCTPSPLRGEASRFTPQNKLLEKNQGICGATQPDSEKAHVLRKRVSVRIECRTAFIGRLPHLASATRIAAVSAPATRPPILAPSRSLYKQHFLRKFHLFQAPVRKALRVRPEPMVEKTGLEPVTSRKPSGRTTKLCYIPKRPESKRKE